MRALQSKLAKELRKAGIKIPVHNGAKFMYNDTEYTVKKVPKAS